MHASTISLSWSLCHLALSGLFLQLRSVAAVSQSQGNVNTAPLHLPLSTGGRLSNNEQNADSVWLVDNSTVVEVNNAPDDAKLSLSPDDDETPAAVFAGISKRGLDTAFPWPGGAGRVQVLGEPSPTPAPTPPPTRTQNAAVIREIFDIQDPNTKAWHQFATRTRPQSIFDPSNSTDDISRPHKLALLQDALSQIQADLARGRVALNGTAAYAGTDGWTLRIASKPEQVIPLALLKLYLRAAVSDPKYAALASTTVHLYSRTGIRTRKQTDSPRAPASSSSSLGRIDMTDGRAMLRELQAQNARIRADIRDARTRPLPTPPRFSTVSRNVTTTVTVTYGPSESPRTPWLVDSYGPGGPYRFVTNEQVVGMNPFETRPRVLGRRADDEL